MAIVKTITDLERIGDEAGKIAKVALETFSGEQRDLLSSLDNLGRRVLEYLQVTLDAFTRMDVDAAIKAHKSDDRIDKEYEALMRQLMTYMMEDPRSIPQVMSVIWSARALERIGDHAKNIAKALNVSLDFLAGEASVLVKDKKVLQRMEDISNLSEDKQKYIFEFIDMCLRDYKTQQAYK